MDATRPAFIEAFKKAFQLLVDGHEESIDAQVLATSLNEARKEALCDQVKQDRTCQALEGQQIT